ncbi:MAG: inositol 2-dehydrogenase [Gammaproteobacteria bacterium]
MTAEDGVIHIALIGAGRIGKMHADCLRAHPRFYLAAVCDRDLQLANDAAAESIGDIAVADNADDILADDNITALLVASPNDSHCDYIERATGKAVLCEKPVAESAARAKQCANVIAAKKEPVQIGFNRRHDPGHSQLQKQVMNGDIGKLEKLIITSRDPGLPDEKILRNSGGLFADMMIHDFDMARFVLAEEPVWVFAAGAALTSPLVADIGDIDTAMVVLQTASGVLCTINCSRRAAYGYDQRVEAFGGEGMLISENRTATNVQMHTAKATSAKEPLLHFFIDRYEDSYRRQLDAFADAIAGKHPPMPTLEDGRRAQTLAEAAALSMREKRPIAVDAG